MLGIGAARGIVASDESGAPQRGRGKIVASDDGPGGARFLACASAARAVGPAPASQGDSMHSPILTRRQLLAQAAAGGALLGLGSRAFADGDFPKGPIKFIVPYAPGGVTDLTMRTVGKAVSERIGQPVVIDNRAGAGGAVGMTAVANAQPDGYTIGATASSTIIATPLLTPVGYDPAKDFAFISLLATVPMVLTVNASIPVSNAEQFLKYVAANKGKLSYGSTAVGHYGHVALLEVSDELHAGMVHSPYKGESPLMQDVL